MRIDLDLRTLAGNFDVKTSLQHPLRHILAEASLDKPFEELVQLDPGGGCNAGSLHFQTNTRAHSSQIWSRKDFRSVCGDIIRF